MSDFLNRDDIFKGINAYVRVMHRTSDDGIICMWDGPSDGLAAASVEFMKDVLPHAKIGDIFELGGLSLEIVDFNPLDLGNFWTVRQG